MASYKQIGENKYKIYVELGYDDNGKRIRKTKTVTAKSERALKKAITELEVEVRNTKTMDLDGISFETFYEEHFKKLYLKTLKVSTQNLYKENEGRVLKNGKCFYTENSETVACRRRAGSAWCGDNMIPDTCSPLRGEAGV